MSASSTPRCGNDGLPGQSMLGGWATILEVAALLRLRTPRDADGCAAVRDSVAELVDGRGLVGSGEAPLVALTISLNVLLVLLPKLLNGGDDLLVAASGPC